jgi:hypothetical protein
MNAFMASKEPLDDTLNRSLVKVEHILPCTEHGLDPRDFYAPDSPVLEEYFDSGQFARIRNVSIQMFKMMTKSRALLNVVYGFLI